MNTELLIKQRQNVLRKEILALLHDPALEVGYMVRDGAEPEQIAEAIFRFGMGILDSVAKYNVDQQMSAHLKQMSGEALYNEQEETLTPFASGYLASLEWAPLHVCPFDETDQRFMKWFQAYKLHETHEQQGYSLEFRMGFCANAMGEKDTNDPFSHQRTSHINTERQQHLDWQEGFDYYDKTQSDETKEID